MIPYRHIGYPTVDYIALMICAALLERIAISDTPIEVILYDSLAEYGCRSFQVGRLCRTSCQKR